MLSKSIRPSSSLILSSIKRDFGSNPGILSRVFNSVDRGTLAYQVARHDPTQPLKSHKALDGTFSPADYNVTELSNGFTVATESQTFPGPVHFGFLINVGSRDETSETSGACLALKNTYLKTLKHTNETINYGMIQMSGGKLTLEYDREFMYFSGNCIEYDVVDMFQLLVDVALEPRSVMAANVARSKNRKSHDLLHHLHKYDPSMSNKDLLMRTAFGYNTLGMPVNGLEHNIDHIDARMLQSFILDNVTPGKCTIVASGVKNHREFVDLVKERLGDYLPVPEHRHSRAQSEYIGGEYRTWTESPQTHINLAFPAAHYTHDDVVAYLLMNKLIGSTDSLGQPGKGIYSRVITNLLQKNSFIHHASGIFHGFTDAGLFGIQIQGAGSHSQDIMYLALEELNRLKQNISDEELHRAKKQLKHDYLSALDCQQTRTEELARSVAIYKDHLYHKYLDMIDAVTGQQINQAAEKAFAGKPSLLVTGDAINLVPNVTDVHKQLN